MTGPPPLLQTRMPARRTPAPERPAIFGGEPLFSKLLPIARPVLPPALELLGWYQAIAASGAITNGSMVQALETAAAAYLGVPECVAVSSCTSGLMLVERCLDLKGRVIVPSFTFFATAHSLLWNGLEPVLVDCDEHTWNLDPDRVLRAIRSDVGAILAVRVFGNPAGTAELGRIASRAGVRLIFDAAHAFGARFEGSSVGGFGDAEVFSLSPTKLLVAGEGGLIATRNRELAARLRAARNYGDAGSYDCSILGLNARMTEFQAALALAGLPSVDAQVQRRNRLAGVYEQYLGREPGVQCQRISALDCAARKDFSIVIDESRFGISPQFLQTALQKENIQVRRYFDPPLHRQQLYRRYYRPKLDRLEVTSRISRGVLSLPMHAGMTGEDAARIALRILAIRDFARK